MSRKSSRRRSRRITRRRNSRRHGSCASGYVRSKATGLCVYATGRAGRKLNKKRAAAKRSHKRSGRPSPNVAAGGYPVGFVKTGHDGNLWRIARNVNGVKRWVKA